MSRKGLRGDNRKFAVKKKTKKKKKPNTQKTKKTTKNTRKSYTYQAEGEVVNKKRKG